MMERSFAHHTSDSSLTTLLSLVAMWFAMMSAMMAPVASPWVVAFRRFQLRVNRRAAVATFIGGYASAWLLYSLLGAIAQMVLHREIGAAAMHGLPPAAAAFVLAGAGVVQFTSLKKACLRHCRNPVSYLLTRWHNGPERPWRIDFTHGLFCVGCCWAMMATTLAVGMANVWWMIALTAGTFVEQVARRGDLARSAIGIALLASGIARIL